MMRGCVLFLGACIVLFLACSPCASLRDEWNHHLRSSALVLGASQGPDAGIPPHAVLFLGPDSLAPLIDDLTTADLLPTSVSRRHDNPERTGRNAPVELRISLAFDAVSLDTSSGLPALRVRVSFNAPRSSMTLRTPRLDVEVPLDGRAELLVPITLDETRLDVRFSEARVDSLHVEPAAATGPVPLATDEAWIEPSVRALIHESFAAIPGRTALASLTELAVGRDRYPLRIARTRVTDDWLAIELVSPLRPQGTFAPEPPPAGAGDAAWSLHPGILAADLASILLDGGVSRASERSGSFARVAVVNLDFAPEGTLHLTLRYWETEGATCGRLDLVHDRPLPARDPDGEWREDPRALDDYRIERTAPGTVPPSASLLARVFTGVGRRARTWLDGPSLATLDGSMLRFEASSARRYPHRIESLGRFVPERNDSSILDR